MGPAQHGVHARHQLVGIERLIEVIVGAFSSARARSVASPTWVSRSPASSCWPGAGNAASRPVHVGHEQVQDNQVGQTGHFFQGLPAIRRSQDGKPGALQKCCQVSRDGGSSSTGGL
jgi:hypothetical protein